MEPPGLNVVPDFNAAAAQWEKENPQWAKFGWGPSAKAERWNGRHAMFGWAMIIGTLHAQANGLIPNAELPIDASVWGPLAYLGDGSTISNERAIVLIANVHALVMSVCAAFAPLDFQDKLLYKEGEAREAAAGFLPKFVPGLTPEAELFNGRLAMLGLVLTVHYSLFTSTPFGEVIKTIMPGVAPGI